MKQIGLFFGTFNPIHIGHLAIANHIAEFSELDEVWFVVTPRSPFKQKASLLSDRQRYDMVFQATKEYDKLRPSDIEFGLKQPNYTVDTLAYIQEKHPDHQFALIMGEDNLKSFHKWKNYKVIIDNHQLFVYPRISESKIDNQFIDHSKITHIDAPIMEISSTFIRKAIKEGKNIRPLLPASVWQYVDEMNFYK